ncbi:MAG: radical SAM protein [Gammaproteobacteria bacterium]|nr:radical SAM protein [Gammaproteobacteria bacterium]
MKRFSLPYVIRSLRPVLEASPTVKNVLRYCDQRLGLLRHSVASVAPFVILPSPRQLTIAITAKCNLACIGCRYGRDFMVGSELPLKMLEDALTDARDLGMHKVRLYGGEPLLHPQLPKMVEHAEGLGLKTYVTTNGTLLKQRSAALYDAGLRTFTIGFYGVDESYNAYTQRPGHFQKLEAGLEYVRDQFGQSVELQLNFVLMRPTCNLDALNAAWDLAERFDMFVHIDLVSYSLPFFTEGPNRELRFQSTDYSLIEPVVSRLVELKRSHPTRFPCSMEFLKSIPDWLLLREQMRIPCDAYEMIWIGADGTVQLCDTHFKLGNLHDNRLRDILFSAEHKQACRDGFVLNCPNCMCRTNNRIIKDFGSMQRYH